ncbi:diphthamide biosynthesis protein 4, partial [Clohesyomyces aquaticus]
KNYYLILDLPPPTSSSSNPPITEVVLRKAYKRALLRAHPDKNTQAQTHAPDTETEIDILRRDHGKVGVQVGKCGCTVDDVKEAYLVLGEAAKKREYDVWLRTHSHALPQTQINSLGLGNGVANEDFILGLEVLDLEDFECTVLESGSRSGSEVTRNEEEGEGEMVYTRPCRCGSGQGFRFLEKELEQAARRGEREILVGCEGCSLWVRVGFDVD